MFDSFTDTHVLNKLYEIQTLIKNDPEYYMIIDKIIKEIEKPVRYIVSMKFKDCRVVKHTGILKHYVRDKYLYLVFQQNNITICYNMDEMISYQVMEIRQEDT